jgi:hypothetical protein
MMRRLLASLTSVALLIAAPPAPLRAQGPAAAPAQGVAPIDAATTATADKFNTEQLDALLAPIALYPDTLLTQLLMATTNPLEIIAARRWLDQAGNKDLKGAALETALRSQSWDPSVKSLIPFPQVLDMLNEKLEWTQQLGYAMQVQEQDVFGSIQRLRLQAENAGKLQSTSQQTVRTEAVQAGNTGQTTPSQQVIVIEPTQADTVYVPSYDPNVVYGTWPYPATPPVYYPPPVAYGLGSALLTGMAFGAGVAITAGLWGWARPNWSGGSVNVNVNRWNNISANRSWSGSANGNWRANTASFRTGGGTNRPGGPVGRPSRSAGLPSNAIGRAGVSVPGNVVRPPGGMGPGNRPGIGQGGGAIANRPGGAGQGGPVGGSAGNRPGIGQGAGAPGNRPGQGGARPPGAGSAGQRPNLGQGGGGGGGRSPGAFSGMSEGRSAQQFGNRGAQSRQATATSRGNGGGRAAAGGARGGGGGGRRR